MKSNDIKTLQKEIDRLKRVNQELIDLFEPIDKIVRPLTKLGHSVYDKALELIQKQIEGDVLDKIEFINNVHSATSMQKMRACAKLLNIDFDENLKLLEQENKLCLKIQKLEKKH